MSVDREMILVLSPVMVIDPEQLEEFWNDDVAVHDVDRPTVMVNEVVQVEEFSNVVDGVTEVPLLAPVNEFE